MKEIHIEVTLKCPFNCIHCSGFANSTHQHIDISTIKNRLNKIKSLKGEIAELVITGGEPITRDDLPDILEYARNTANKSSLFTTGSDGKSKIRLQYWQHLKSSGLDTAVFSVHSINSHVNNSFFKYDITASTLDSILNANSAGLNTEINCVIAKKNFSTIHDTISTLLARYGISKIRLLRFVSQGRGADQLDALTPDQNDIELLIGNLKNEFKEKVHFEGFPSLHKCRSNENVGNGCQFGANFFYIDINGRILPCPAVKQNSTTIIGNIDKDTSVDKFLTLGKELAKSIDVKHDEFACLGQASWKK